MDRALAITKIAATLSADVDAYADLYPRIARVYFNVSPDKSRDSATKDQRVRALLVTQRPLTQAEIVRRLHRSSYSVGRALARLLAAEQVVTDVALNGGRRSYALATPICNTLRSAQEY